MRLSMNTFFICVVFLLNALAVEGIVGVTWGRTSLHNIASSSIVELVLQLGISDVKVYAMTSDVLEPFIGSDISVTISIANTDFYGTDQKPKEPEYFKSQILEWINRGLKIRSVHLGDGTYDQTDEWNISLNAAIFLRKELRSLGHGYINVAYVFANNMIKPVWFVQSASFMDYWTPTLKSAFRAVVDYDLQVGVNVAPLFIDYEAFGFTPEFGFFDGPSLNYRNASNGGIYTNMLDFQIDMFIAAMNKFGIYNRSLVVASIGWATDGERLAGVNNAERFYKGLLDYVSTKKKSPLSLEPIDIYITSLIDETNRSLSGGNHQRHWGIYRNDGTPKFKIDFSGKGRDIWPTKANGVTRLPKRWCLFNGANLTNATTYERVEKQRNFSCSKADCTPSLPQGSCHKYLDLSGKISYAFNMYFQTMNQKVKACDFDGFGVIVAEDPSNGTCIFPIEILSVEDASHRRLKQSTFASHGETVEFRRPRLLPFLFMLFTTFYMLLY